MALFYLVYRASTPQRQVSGAFHALFMFKIYQKKITMKRIYLQHLYYFKALLIIFFTFSIAFIYGQKSPNKPHYRTLKYSVSKEDLKNSPKSPNANFQNNSVISSLISAIPEVAALETYGNNPVLLASGVVLIPIPLYQIKQKGIDLNLSLSYHIGGVRIEEIASWTRLSVYLMVLATIPHRTIRGDKPDEETNGYMNLFTSYNLDDIYNWYQNNSHTSELNNFKNDYLDTDPIDTEADLFNFNLGKYLGKFVYHKTDGIFYTIPRQNLKIEYTSDLSAWIIMTEEGIKYMFGTSEYRWCQIVTVLERALG